MPPLSVGARGFLILWTIGAWTAVLLFSLYPMDHNDLFRIFAAWMRTFDLAFAGSPAAWYLILKGRVLIRMGTSLIHWLLGVTAVFLGVILLIILISVRAHLHRLSL